MTLLYESDEAVFRGYLQAEINCNSIKDNLHPNGQGCVGNISGDIPNDSKYISPKGTFIPWLVFKQNQILKGTEWYNEIVDVTNLGKSSPKITFSYSLVHPASLNKINGPPRLNLEDMNHFIKLTQAFTLHAQSLT